MQTNGVQELKARLRSVWRDVGVGVAVATCSNAMTLTVITL